MPTVRASLRRLPILLLLLCVAAPCTLADIGNAGFGPATLPYTGGTLTFQADVTSANGVSAVYATIYANGALLYRYPYGSQSTLYQVGTSSIYAGTLPTYGNYSTTPIVYTADISMQDGAGNVVTLHAAGSCTQDRDSQPPTIANVSLSPSQMRPNWSQCFVSADVTDPLGVVSVIATPYLNGAPLSPVTLFRQGSTVTYAGYVNVSSNRTAAPIVYTASITATDTLGNAVTVAAPGSCIQDFDNLAPVVSNGTVSPAQISPLNGGFQFSANIVDPAGSGFTTGIEDVQTDISTNGGPLQTFDYNQALLGPNLYGGYINFAPNTSTAPKVYTVYLSATDWAGNKVGPVAIGNCTQLNDNQPPVVSHAVLNTASLTPAGGSITVTATVDDTGQNPTGVSGVGALMYINGKPTGYYLPLNQVGTSDMYTGTYNPGGNNSNAPEVYTALVQADDWVSNRATVPATGSCTQPYDNTFPIVTPALSGTPDGSGYYHSPVTITLTATDPDGTVDIPNIYYNLDGSNGGAQSGPFVGSTFFSVTSNGSHSVYFYCVDRAGNVNYAGSPLTFKIGATSPVTIVTLSGTHGINGWYTSPVTVTLTATENGGSVAASTTYSVDNGTAQTYSAPFTVTGDGAHTVTFSSTDNAGYSETPHSVTFSVDATPPTTTASVSGATVTMAAADATSGVASTSYSIDNGAQQIYTAPITLSGSHTISYFSTDRAGNAETPKTLTVQIAPPPVTTASLSGTSGTNGWYTSPVQVMLSATDSGGPGVAATYYTVYGGSPQTYSGTPVTVTGDGTHTVTCWSADTSGISETPHSQTMMIDGTPPVTTAARSGSTVTLTAADAASGVAATYYRISGGLLYFYRQPFTINLSNQQAVTFYSVDKAGNTETLEHLPPPVPTLKSITPVTVAAGGPDLTLKAFGANFTSRSVIQWNGAALPTTFVSGTTLTAPIPAALTAMASKAQVTVITPAPGGGTSVAKLFTVTAIGLKTNSPGGITRDPVSGILSETFTFQNIGYNPISSLRVTQAKLGSQKTLTPIPLAVGTLALGASGSATLTFPGLAGTPGSSKALNITLAYTGGTSVISWTEVLP